MLFRSGLGRGIIAGIICVASIVAWAVNVETMFDPKAVGGWWGMVGRLILCDAIPLATLFSLYQALGQSGTIEDLIRSILLNMLRVFGWRPHQEIDFDEWQPPASR